MSRICRRLDRCRDPVRVDHVVRDVARPAGYGELDDSSPERTATEPFGEEIALDRLECTRSALWSAGAQRRSRVDRRQPDTAIMGANQTGGVDDNNVVWPAAVAPGVEQLI